jgi:hypothetical protein
MVETSNDTTASQLRQIYDRTKIQNKEFFKADVVAEYFGDINENSISTISDDVEHKLIESLENRKITKRIFNIFIEGLQNIFKHGSCYESGKHMGACLLTKTNKTYRIHFFNISANEEIAAMSEYLDFLNGLDMDQTKKFYMERLINGQITARGGASLGYIIMKLKSNNNIKYSFESATDLLSCYHIEIEIEISNEE